MEKEGDSCIVHVYFDFIICLHDKEYIFISLSLVFLRVKPSINLLECPFLACSFQTTILILIISWCYLDSILDGNVKTINSPIRYFGNLAYLRANIT